MEIKKPNEIVNPYLNEMSKELIGTFGTPYWYISNDDLTKQQRIDIVATKRLVTQKTYIFKDPNIRYKCQSCDFITPIAYKADRHFIDTNHFLFYKWSKEKVKEWSLSTFIR